MRTLYFSCLGVAAVTLLSVLSGAVGKTYIEDLTLTAAEKKVLDKFRELVVDQLPHEYMKKDTFLIRWLRAKFYKISDAQKMLLDYIDWRAENNLDTIHEEDFSDLARDYKYYLESRTKDGKPTLYLNGGSWDFRNIALSGKREHFNRYIDKILDEACGLVRELGEKYKNVSQGVLLLNMDGFNLIQHGCLQCVPLLLRIVTQYEAHHPGCVDALIIINLPQAAQPIVEAVRPLFHPETRKIFHVYGPNKAKWFSVLRREYDIDELPVEVGGNKVYKKYQEDDNF